MSELVERHLESMTVEIEEMRRTKLFSIDETRAILRKRKQFEYKINGVAKNLPDYKAYIQYEKILLKDIKVRRNKYRIADRKSSIEFKILKRIKYLYEIALQRFSNDFNLCLSYFKFCKESNYHQAASLVVQNMIKNFSQNPEVWQVAAAWHIKKDLNQALNVIHKGLAIHKDCQMLYSEAIQLELMNGEKDDWTDGTSTKEAKEAVCYKKIETYVHSIFKNISDFKFLLEVLKLLEPHVFTKGIQDVIIKRLLSNHSDEELVWHNLAQREKRGHHYDVADANLSKSSKFCFNRCVKKYQEGLEKISKTNKPELWKLYLDCLIDMQQQSNVASIVKINTLKDAFEEAYKEMSLSEQYFIVWVKLLEDDEAGILEVLRKGLKALPESVELWKLRLKYAVLKDHIPDFNRISKLAIMSLKEKSTPIWIMILRYHTLTSSNEVIESVYRDGIKQPKPVSEVLKPEYIQWIALMKGIWEARQEYRLLAREKPFCKELHAAMVKIESAEMDVKVDELEQVYKLACEQFGTEDVDVWINYIEFCLKNRKKYQDVKQEFDIDQAILQIHRDAENALKSNELLLSEFREKYDSVKSSCSL